MMQARREHTILLTSYVEGFLEDTGEMGDARIALESALSGNRLFIWFDKRPVSMAASSRPTPNGICINMVYTPPELRRQGYATAVVSTLSDMLLKNGKTFCMLYTDLSNTTSNSIYQRIGYQPVLDCYHYRFVC
jgi:predicted GNAT family acetyltransferase